MQLTSNEFDDGGPLPAVSTCDGAGTSPALQWDDLPEGTVELALTCEDPDAPNGTFVHWVIWALEPDEHELPAGERGRANQGRNGWGETGWGPACPPEGHGTHRYVFTLYALGERVELVDGATVEELRAAIDGTVLAEARLVGTYSR